MPVVTFNENVDHHVKGDIVKLSADELKAIDLYAEQHDIKKPYTKGEHEVTNTDDTPNITDVARDNSLKRSKKDGNAKTDETPVGSVESEEQLRENANKQAVGETLPGQEGDNPTEADLETAVEDAAEDEAEEQAATDGEGSADVVEDQDAGEGDSASDESQDDSESDEGNDGSLEATELPAQEDAKEDEADQPKVDSEPNTEGSGDVTPPATQANKARNSNKK